MITLIKGDCLDKMNDIPNKSIDAIITDPPYGNMVSENWDNKISVDQSLFFNNVAKRSYNLLRYGGRYILFGSNKTMLYVYNSINNIYLHRELITIDKGIKVVGGRNTKKYKQHPNCTEYININTKFAHEYTKQILLNANKDNLSSNEINNKLGYKSNGGGMWSIYTGNNVCKQVPTKEAWTKFKTIFNIPDYNDFKEVFNIEQGVYNVFKNINFNIKNRMHPTQKPISLMEYLIKTYTNENETVLDFTAGSFTTAIAAINTNRQFIGIEKDDKYFEIGTNRVQEHVKTLDHDIELIII